MPSSAARAATTPDERAVMIATVTPWSRSIFSPKPSSTWNCLLSMPSASKPSRPSVITPSTSNAARRMRAARSRTGAGRSVRGV